MKIIGHRGAKGLAPENTLAAFAKALEYHVDEIELDVRVTKDGVPIIEHDKTLKNQAGDRLVVARHSYDELKRHKPELATLQQAIETINRHVPIYIEIKPGEPVAAIADCITHNLTRGWQPEDFLFGSYSFKTLKQITQLVPNVVLIVIDDWSSVRAVWRARRLGTKRLSMSTYCLWSYYIRVMARRGYQISAYTINDPRKAQRWAEAGLFAAVTDYPDLYQKRADS